MNKFQHFLHCGARAESSEGGFREASNRNDKVLHKKRQGEVSGVGWSNFHLSKRVKRCSIMARSKRIGRHDWNRIIDVRLVMQISGEVCVGVLLRNFGMEGFRGE